MEVGYVTGIRALDVCSGFEIPLLQCLRAFGNYPKSYHDVQCYYLNRFALSYCFYNVKAKIEHFDRSEYCRERVPADFRLRSGYQRAHISRYPRHARVESDRGRMSVISAICCLAEK